MDIREQLGIVRDYYEYVSKTDEEPLMCYKDDAILLYHAEGDQVVLKCTHCGNKQYPGIGLLRNMQMEVDEWKKSPGTT
jgi:hypothetical protein